MLLNETVDLSFRLNASFFYEMASLQKQTQIKILIL